MDAWAWSDHLAPWLAARVELPIGALFCVIDGPTRGRPWSATAARGELRRYAAAAGVRRNRPPTSPELGRFSMTAAAPPSLPAWPVLLRSDSRAPLFRIGPSKQ
jgi:hypothetical protein